MGRRGRPPKTKAVPRRSSVSCSDHDSSLSPERFMFQSSQPGEVNPSAAATSMGAPASGTAGLSWLSVLKGASTQSGKPSSSGLSPTLIPTVPLASSLISVNHACALNPNVPINVTGNDSLYYSILLLP
ncbi:unnamed protein product [Amaranthus hypochondriacus]